MDDRKPTNNRSKLLLTLAVALIAAGPFILPACTAESSGQSAGGDDGVMARIGESVITKADLEEQGAEAIKQAEMQKLQCESNYKRSRHQALESTLESLVRDRLIEDEAKARGISKEDLLEAEVNSKIAEVDDAAVEAFYNQNRARINQPLERVSGQIKQYLSQEGRKTVYESFIASLESKYEVTYNLGPYRVEVAKGDAPTKGPDSAAVTIVEFSDFECPYCSRVVPTLDQIKEKYGDNVQIAFRHFPLAFHQNAQKASEASMCAADQGKFWEMHDLMFAEQKQLAVDQLKEKATRIGLDAAAFNECLDSDKYAQQVQDDMQAGVLAGVSGTPAMFINGRFVNGAQPYETIAEIVDEELKAAGVAN
jgi:protein-disulfide isomerase